MRVKKLKSFCISDFFTNFAHVLSTILYKYKTDVIRLVTEMGWFAIIYHKQYETEIFTLLPRVMRNSCICC